MSVSRDLRAFAPGVFWLIAFRFILGVGIGGDYPVSATIISEFAGRLHRGLLVSLVFAMQAAGLIIGPLIAAGLLSTERSPRRARSAPLWVCSPSHCCWPRAG